MWVFQLRQSLSIGADVPITILQMTKGRHPKFLAILLFCCPHLGRVHIFKEEQIMKRWAFIECLAVYTAKPGG